MFFKEFNHFFRDVVPDDESSGTSDFIQEYTSSKQRNRMKKFLEEKNFVPDKDNPKTGWIDSTDTDPKTGKPIRIRFSYDNEYYDANAIGTDYIHMAERKLKKHPSISRSTFAHEDGHLILNRNYEKASAEIDKIAKEIVNSGLSNLMHKHGNSADEYIADKNSLDKVGYDATVRTLKSLKTDTKMYNDMRKSINKNPYDYVIGQMVGEKEELLKHLPKEALMLIGFASSEGMHKKHIESDRNRIKQLISLKQTLIQEKKYNDSLDKYINNNIQRCKDDIIECENKIKGSKAERKKLHEKFSNAIKSSSGDEEKFKKELIAGVDELEKQNNVEMDFRIKMLSFWNSKNHNDMR